MEKDEMDALARRIQKASRADEGLTVADLAAELEVPEDDVILVVESYVSPESGPPEYVGVGQGGGWL